MRKAWSLLHLRRTPLAAAARPVIIFPSQAPHYILPPTTAGVERVFVSPIGNDGCFGLRCYSSEPAVAEIDPDAALIEVLMASRSSDVKKKLESLNATDMTHNSISKVLRGLVGVPEVAREFFDWVLEMDDTKLSSKSYNLMLGVLGCGKKVAEFWDFVDVMKKKGFGLSKSTFSKVSEVFEKEGLENDLNRLKDVISPKQPHKVSKIVTNSEWSEDDMQRMGGLSDKFDKESVIQILEKLKTQPKKALAFFKWVCESSAFESDAHTYKVLARVLARKDCVNEFWSVLDEMRRLDFELEKDTYVKVFEQFLKRNMVKEAVDLYEYKMQSSFKPPQLDGVHLIRKIAGSNCPDIDLFARVVQIYTSGGNRLTKSIFDAVVQSLTHAANLGLCGEFVKAMENRGLEATTSIHSKIVFGYCRASKFDEAGDYLVKLSESTSLDSKPWMCFIYELCRAEEPDKAVHWFREMVDKFGPNNARYAFHELVRKFCLMKKPQDAYNFLVKMVETNQVKTLLLTYETLIKSLLSEGHFVKAISLMPVMKNQGFPPFWRLYVSHISKSGSANDAFTFLNNLSPSTSVFVEMFKSFRKAGRLDEAHKLLSLSPSFIRNDADVLELFQPIKTQLVVPDVDLIA